MLSRKPLTAGIAVAAALISALPVSGWAQEAKPAIGAESKSRITPAASACAAPAGMTRLGQPLSRTGRRLAAGLPITVVAMGSSSTAGAGASSPANSYPSRLEAELRQHFPGHEIRVINQGANGEDAREMLARWDQSVVAYNPDLVVWQVGTNSLLLDRPLTPAGQIILEGIHRLKSAGVDVVLMDSQFAPKVISKPGVDDLTRLMSMVAKTADVPTFHRFAVMSHWHEVGGMPFQAFLSADDLHMNDWSYGCIAKLLAASIAEACTRSTVSAEASAAARRR
jgi:acyl-CoA thioesterase I